MSELTLTQADKGKFLEVDRDDVIVIRLEENPTTGYQWAVDKADDMIFVPLSPEFLLPEEPRFGEGGTRVFGFKAKTAGSAAIQLKHWRKWEGDASIIDRFDVTINVG